VRIQAASDAQDAVAQPAQAESAGSVGSVSSFMCAAKSWASTVKEVVAQNAARR
jgi:hypothetical protein